MQPPWLLSSTRATLSIFFLFFFYFSCFRCFLFFYCDALFSLVWVEWVWLLQSTSSMHPIFPYMVVLEPSLTRRVQYGQQIQYNTPPGRGGCVLVPRLVILYGCGTQMKTAAANYSPLKESKKLNNRPELFLIGLANFPLEESELLLLQSLAVEFQQENWSICCHKS